MHELSVTQNLLAVVLEHAEKAGARRVTRIELEVGELSGLVDESLQFYFDFLSQGTLAEGAHLAFNRIPARLACRGCGSEFAPEEHNWLCPACGATGGQIIAGQELSVESIEIE